MTAKDYLRQIRRMDIQINQLLKELSDIRQSETWLSSIDYSADRVQHSVSDASYVKTIERYVDLQIKIDKKIDRYVSRKNKAIEEIQRLSKDDHVDILFKRYVEYKSFEEICTEMNLSYYRIIHLHGEALNEFNKTILKVSNK